MSSNRSRAFCSVPKSFFLALFATVMLLSHAQALEKEYIILSGEPSLMEWEKFKVVPHDHWWGNFIRTARVRIEDLRTKLGPDARITWLTYAEGYKRRSKQEQQDLIADICSVRDKFKIKLVLFDNAGEVIDYLNAGQPRGEVKIADFGGTSGTQTGHVLCSTTATRSTARPNAGFTKMIFPS